jgi:hypothetical protein
LTNDHRARGRRKSRGDITGAITDAPRRAKALDARTRLRYGARSNENSAPKRSSAADMAARRHGMEMKLDIIATLEA